MNSKIFSILLIISLVAVIPSAYAQITFGEKATQKLVEIRIDSKGNVNVIHVIKSASIPKQVDLIPGTVRDIFVMDEDGEEKQFSVIGDNNAVLIMPSREDSILQYKLEDVISEIDNIWTWDFFYLESTSFILPEEVDLLFANERPVFLNEQKGIMCHGCQMLLEFSINESINYQSVKWEDKEFVVEMASNSNVEEFIFEQSSKSITFNVSEQNRFVITVIPLELLWGPYSVFVDEKKILFQEYFNNGTHVWVTFFPETSGEVTIIGTTVIPEFPIIAPLAIGFLMILVLPFMKKFSLH